MTKRKATFYLGRETVALLDAERARLLRRGVARSRASLSAIVERAIRRLVRGVRAP